MGSRPAEPDLEGEVTNKRVLRIAVPLILSNVTIPLLGVVDTGVVGQLGEAAPIAAVGVGAITLSSLYWAFGFLKMGTAGLAAQALGARDRAEVSALMTRVLMVAAIVGLAMIACQSGIFRIALALTSASAEVEALARDYMRVRIFAAPAAIAVYGLTGWLLAKERTVGLLVLQLVMNGINIALSVFLGLWLELGVVGVAWSSFAAEFFGLVLALFLARDAFDGRAWRNWTVVFDRVRLWHMAAVNSDIMVRSVILMAAFTSFVYLGGRFGDTTLAANQILLQFVYFASYAMDGFTHAAETLVGQAMGARAKARVRRSAYLAVIWAFVVCLVLTVFFALTGPVFVDLMAKAPEVRAAARAYLPWIMVAPVLGCAGWLLDGVFIGATQTRDMRNSMILSGLIYALSLPVLLPALGNHGLWASLLLLFVFRGVTLSLRYSALERAVDS